MQPYSQFEADVEPKSAVHTLPLQYHTGPHYSGMVEVGTAVKRFFVELDLNFDDLLITNKDCLDTENTACPSKESYDEAESSTAENLGLKRKKQSHVEVKGAGIDIIGIEYTDKVCLGPTKDGCFEPQRFVSVTTERTTYGPYDGILGLGPNADSLF